MVVVKMGKLCEDTTFAIGWHEVIKWKANSDISGVVKSGVDSRVVLLRLFCGGRRGDSSLYRSLKAWGKFLSTHKRLIKPLILAYATRRRANHV
jgi:hypothetical protein